MQSEVNIKYVLGLEEKQDKTLQMVQIDRPLSSVIIEELEAMQENPNRNLYDMSSYFYRHVNPIKDCYHYCFPEEYQYSFLNEKVTPVPKDITYWKYREVEDEKRKTWARWQLRKKDVPQSEIEKRWNEYAHKLEYPDKKKYFSMAKKYILCQNLYKAMQEAKGNPDIRMYSRDMLGETQEAALETILGDIDEIDDIQRGFKPVHRTTMKDVNKHWQANRDWANSLDESSQVACEIYKQYFEDIEE